MTVTDERSTTTATTTATSTWRPGPAEIARLAARIDVAKAANARP